MASFPCTGLVKCNRTTSFSPLLFFLGSNSCKISLPRNVHVYGNSFNPFSYQSSNIHRNLYSLRQRGTSLLAFDAKNSESRGGESGDNKALDAVLKLYSAIKNKNTHQLSEILADECRRVCNFLYFFRTFQGKKQVLEFLSYLIRKFGNNIHIVVKPTMHDGMNVSVQWKFEWDKIHVPLGKGFSFHICQIYKGKAVIRNIEMFMEPLFHFEPFRLEIMASVTELLEKIGLLMVWKSENKAKRILHIMLVLIFFAALVFFVKLASYKAVT